MQDGARRSEGELMDYDSIKVMAREQCVAVHDFMALAKGNDPFYLSPTMIAEGKWFAALWERLGCGPGIHLRECHYLAASHRIPFADGVLYENSYNHWTRLASASKYARYLDLVPADMLEDKRRGGVLLPTQVEARGLAVDVETDNLEPDYSQPELPCYNVSGPSFPQRYHLEIWAEKASMESVIRPFVGRYGVVAVVNTGQASITSAWELIGRLRTNPRPCRVFYLADFDPCGDTMPTAVSRKLEFYARQHPEFDIQLHHLAVTEALVDELDLPRAPIKETDKSRKQFETNHGTGAVELEAIKGLHPGKLEKLIKDEILKYYDESLEGCETEARWARLEELDNHRDHVLEKYHEELAQLQAEHKAAFSEWSEKAEPVYSAIETELREYACGTTYYDVPEPEEEERDESVLYDSQRTYLEQLDRYRQHQGKPLLAEEIESRKNFCIDCGAVYRKKKGGRLSQRCQSCRPVHNNRQIAAARARAKAARVEKRARKSGVSKVR